MASINDPQEISDPVPLLSIVAEPPPNVSSPVPNTFVDSAFVRINASTGSKGGNSLERAWSIAKLQSKIADFAAKQSGKFDLQIVGHGMAGFLGLGETWNSIYFDGINFFALDSNPGLLANFVEFRGKLGAVTLAACDVGDVTSSVRAVGGTTLLFALEELWGCPVFGAVGLIDFSTFNEVNGVYEGPRRRWNEREPTARMASLLGDIDRAVPAVEFLEVVVSPALNAAYANSPGRVVSPHLNDMLVSTYQRPRSDGSGAGLATPEFSFKIRTTSLTPNLHGQAWISLDGRCLTIALGDDLPLEAQKGYRRIGRYFYQNYFTDATAGDLAALISELLKGPVQQPATVKATGTY